MTLNSNKADNEQSPRETQAVWASLEPYWDELLALSESERRRRVHELFIADPDLLERTEALLRAIDASAGFLDGSVAELMPDLVCDLGVASGEEADGASSARGDSPHRQNHILGVYRIMDLLGRGGMGEVYLAQRNDGAFERLVAIKISRARHDSERAQERFRREQRILADLDHRYIARLHDAGLTDDQLPYVVMEYIEGSPLDVHCAEASLPIADRLLLFLDICEAVEHAHRRLVIHRDLKPSNIMVDTKGRVKLLDFGIAKLLDTQESEDRGTLMLTPDYAAPEQFTRGRLSTATDVYALGVILFELLTGRRLRAGESSPPVWIEQALLRQSPRPSEQVDDAKIARVLHGDLDAIVSKSLEPDPEQRYESARAFADDIRRHLESRPVLARRGSNFYQARRFLRRHWLAVSTGVVMMALVLSGAAIAWRESQVAQRERWLADASAARAARVSTFLVDLFEGWDPYRFRHGEVSARDLLDLGAERAQLNLQDDPQVRAELLTTLGQVYLRLGLVDESRQVVGGLEPERIGEFGLAAENEARLLALQGRIESARGDFGKASGYFERALEALDTSGRIPADAAATALRCELLIRQGDVALDRGEWDTAASLLGQARTLAQSLGDRSLEAGSLASLSRAVGRGRYDEKHLRAALDIYRSLDVADPVALRSTLNNLAIHLMERGDWRQSASMFEEQIELSREIFGALHPELARGLVNLARLRIDQGQMAPALELLEEADRIYRQLGAGEQGIEPLALKMNRGRAMAELGHDEGLEILQAARAEALEQLGAEHPLMPAVDVRLAECELRLGRPGEALGRVRVALKGLSSHDLRRVDGELVRGAALVALGCPAEVAESLENVVAKLEETLPTTSWRLAWARLELADARRQLGDPRAFGDDWTGSAEILVQSRGVENPLSQRARGLEQRGIETGACAVAGLGAYETVSQSKSR